MKVLLTRYLHQLQLEMNINQLLNIHKLQIEKYFQLKVFIKKTKHIRT